MAFLIEIYPFFVAGVNSGWKLCFKKWSNEASNNENMY